MDREQRDRIWLSAQNWLYVLLVLAAAGLLAWLSTRYTYEADWTANNRNSLTGPSVKLVETLDGPVTITAWAREDQALRKSIRDFVARYQRAKPDVTLAFRNPDTAPQQARELGITTDGTLVLEYQGRTEQVANPREQPVTNALARLARQGGRKVVFLAGHGERSPEGRANFDLGTYGRELGNKGIELDTLNLAKTPRIPDDTQLLVIASPKVSYLPGEAELVRDYVEDGGNLLWLAEPGGMPSLDPVAETLGISFLPGTVVDPTTQLFGIQDPSYSLVTDYPDSGPTSGLSAVTLYPQAAAVESDNDGNHWQVNRVLTTAARTWTETGELTGELNFDEDSRERAGPLTIGLSLTRKLSADDPESGNEPGGQKDGADKQAGETGKPAGEPAENGTARTQRVLVIGDGDFLSNQFLGNGANLDLGVRMINWLVGDDRFIEIPPRAAPDTGLNLSNTASAVIAVGSMIVLPLLLALAGGVIWWRRRRA
jgi:ABC-type uncharacterized transport system involved in gliding motility auxiliary subunit